MNARVPGVPLALWSCNLTIGARQSYLSDRAIEGGWQRQAEEAANRHGFKKLSDLKLRVTQIIKDYVGQGGFLFAMCSGTDTFDIALAARNTGLLGGCMKIESRNLPNR